MLGLASAAVRAWRAVVTRYDRRVRRVSLVCGGCATAKSLCLLSEAWSRANRESQHQKGGYRKHHDDALH